MVKITAYNYKKLLILVLLVVVISALFVYLASKMIVSSSYFNIKQIVVTGDYGIRNPDNLLDKNIFSIQLKQVEKKLLFEYPKLRSVKISRSMPNTIIIEIEPKLPVAKLSLKIPSYGRKKLLFLDRDLTLLDLSNKGEYESLPEIVGFKGKVSGARIGQVIYARELDVVLKILEEYAKTEELKKYLIDKIDVSDIGSIFFWLRIPEGAKIKNRSITGNRRRLKIIIGSSQINRRVRTLSALLLKIKSNLEDIKYIDLRFKDPVAGKR